MNNRNGISAIRAFMILESNQHHPSFTVLGSMNGLKANKMSRLGSKLPISAMQMAKKQ